MWTARTNATYGQLASVSPLATKAKTTTARYHNHTCQFGKINKYGFKNCKICGNSITVR